MERRNCHFWRFDVTQVKFTEYCRGFRSIYFRLDEILGMLHLSREYRVR